MSHSLNEAKQESMCKFISASLSANPNRAELSSVPQTGQEMLIEWRGSLGKIILMSAPLVAPEAALYTRY